VMLVPVGITFYLDVRPMLGWQGSGTNSRKFTVFSDGRGPKCLGIYGWWSF